MGRRPLLRRLVVLAVAAGVIAVGYRLLAPSDLARMLNDPESLRRWAMDLGWLGPAGLMGVLAIAIVVSPLPSAPIALAAGAAYGHFFGTIYVVGGAVVGALVAFAIARVAGGARLRRVFGERLSMGLLGSQNRLMALVFGLRLLPFVSFDIVSYAAGLSPLTGWRFTLATIAGVTPISFLLTHFGDALVGGELEAIGLAVLALGLLTGGSAVLARVRRRADEDRSGSDR